MQDSTTNAASRLTSQEKLLIAQAVYKLGALQWPAISKLLVDHPVCAGRPGQLFTPEACEASYLALMELMGANTPWEGAGKPQAKVHLRLAQTFYIARMQELKESITTYELKFAQLMTEIGEIKAGRTDGRIKAELRAVLSRKYGKRLLDSWVPEEAVAEVFDEVKTDGQGGESVTMPMAAEATQQSEGNVSKQGEAEVELGNELDVEKQAETTVNDAPSEKEVPQAGPTESVQETSHANAPREPDVLDVTRVIEPEPESALALIPSPTKSSRSDLSPPPDLDPSPATPAPRSGRTTNSRTAKASADEAPQSARASKRKANPQPDARPAKRAARQRGGADAEEPTTLIAVEGQEPVHAEVSKEAEAGYAKQEDDGAERTENDAEAAEVPEEAAETMEAGPEPDPLAAQATPQEAEEEEEVVRKPTRRASARASRGGRASLGAIESPAPSPRAKPSPAPSRRGQSVTSNASATPVTATEDRRGSRRSARRGRDTAKSAREHSVVSAAVDSVKEEVEDEEGEAVEAEAVEAEAEVAEETPDEVAENGDPEVKDSTRTKSGADLKETADEAETIEKAEEERQEDEDEVMKGEEAEAQQKEELEAEQRPSRSSLRRKGRGRSTGVIEAEEAEGKESPAKTRSKPSRGRAQKTDIPKDDAEEDEEEEKEQEEVQTRSSRRKRREEAERAEEMDVDEQEHTDADSAVEPIRVQTQEAEAIEIDAEKEGREDKEDDDRQEETKVSARPQLKGNQRRTSKANNGKRSKRGANRKSTAQESDGEGDDEEPEKGEADFAGADVEALPSATTDSKTGLSLDTATTTTATGTTATATTEKFSASEPSSARATGREKRPRYSSTSDTKATQKMLFSLHEAISGHRNGNVFQVPVKKSEARDYYDIVKKPMDLKTIKTRIKDQAITTIEEMERDVLLMFANAMMYNAKDSQVYKMAKEMMQEAEQLITHFKSVQYRGDR